MERSQETLPIKGKDLAAYSDRANAMVKQVTYIPKAEVDASPKDKPTPGALVWRSSPTMRTESKSVSVLALAHALNPNTDLLLEGKVNQAVTAVWQGLRIGIYLGKLYEKVSNLEVLMAQNQRAGGLDGGQKAEFREKHTTTAAITLFAAAYYIAWELSRSEGGESKAEVHGVPEVNLQNPVEGVNCMLYYYGAYLSRPDVVQNADDFVKVTQLYFKAMANEIISRVGSLKYADVFTERAYKLEQSEFSLNGFVANMNGSSQTVEFNRVDINDIVGNRAAKRQARLMAQRLMCYDFETKQNPVTKLGGLPKLRMGEGPPGTGKSMLIAAIATQLADYCKALNFPFSFRPLPDNIVSTFQGGTAEKGVEWFVGFQDPTRILYGAIDDGEVNLEDRTRQNVSSGVREFIGVFLRRTEGAYAVNYGNFVIDLFTNIPDQIDKAVLSRIVSRYLIAGAQTREDFMDQEYIWWKKYRALDAGFIDMQDDPTYEFMHSQAMLRNLSEVMERYSEPKDERLRRIFRKVSEKYDPKQHAFFGELYAQIRLDFPFFTSRDVRNIDAAVDGRIMDFDLPDEWLEHPDQFYFLPYGEKHKILVGMMKDNMKGLKFSEVKLQEAIVYLDQMVRMAEVTRVRMIDEGVANFLKELEIKGKLDELRRQGKLEYLGLPPAKGENATAH